MNKLRVFEQYDVFISIIFHHNADREPAWHFQLDSAKEREAYFTSGIIGNYEQCEKEALKKAVDYI